MIPSPDLLEPGFRRKITTRPRLMPKLSPAFISPIKTDIRVLTSIKTQGRNAPKLVRPKLRTDRKQWFKMSVATRLRLAYRCQPPFVFWDAFEGVFPARRIAPDGTVKISQGLVEQGEEEPVW